MSIYLSSPQMDVVLWLVLSWIIDNDIQQVVAVYSALFPTRKRHYLTRATTPPPSVSAWAYIRNSTSSNAFRNRTSFDLDTFHLLAGR